MKKLIFLMGLVGLLIPGAGGQSVFDGTWKADFSTTKSPAKPFQLLLKDRIFSCNTCDFPFAVKADGTDQVVQGDPYRDTLAVKVVSDLEIQETSKKSGKVVTTSKICISPDSNEMTADYSDSSATNGGPPVVATVHAKRIGKAPFGAHAVSGTWRTETTESSENGALYTFKVRGDEITMTTPTGQSYTARLDGTQAPVKGDPGSNTVKVRLIRENTLEEVYLLDGKPQKVYRTVVNADGKRAVVSTEDKHRNTTTTFESVKQE